MMSSHTVLLLHILLIEDSWKHYRIHNELIGKLKNFASSRSFLNWHFSNCHFSGVSEDREGLLDTIKRNRLNYQKLAHQCIKCLVHLFRKKTTGTQYAARKPTDFFVWPCMWQRHVLAYSGSPVKRILSKIVDATSLASSQLESSRRNLARTSLTIAGHPLPFFGLSYLSTEVFIFNYLNLRL